MAFVSRKAIGPRLLDKAGRLPGKGKDPADDWLIGGAPATERGAEAPCLAVTAQQDRLPVRERQ